MANQETTTQKESNPPAGILAEPAFGPGPLSFNGRVLPERTQTVLRKVHSLLAAGHPQEAANVARAASGDTLIRNAQGVAWLRAGDIPAALRLFRELALVTGGVSLRPEAPTIVKTNFATALLLSGHVAGCSSALDEITDREHPAVVRLRSAINQWKAGLTFWQKLMWKLGTEPNRPVSLDGPLGDLL